MIKEKNNTRKRPQMEGHGCSGRISPARAQHAVTNTRQTAVDTAVCHQTPRGPHALAPHVLGTLVADGRHRRPSWDISMDAGPPPHPWPLPSCAWPVSVTSQGGRAQKGPASPRTCDSSEMQFQNSPEARGSACCCLAAWCQAQSLRNSARRPRLPAHARTAPWHTVVPFQAPGRREASREGERHQLSHGRAVGKSLVDDEGKHFPPRFRCAPRRRRLAQKDRTQ